MKIIILYIENCKYILNKQLLIEDDAAIFNNIDVLFEFLKPSLLAKGVLGSVVIITSFLVVLNSVKRLVNLGGIAAPDLSKIMILLLLISGLSGIYLGYRILNLFGLMLIMASSKNRKSLLLKKLNQDGEIFLSRVTDIRKSTQLDGFAVYFSYKKIDSTTQDVGKSLIFLTNNIKVGDYIYILKTDFIFIVL